MKQNEKKPLAKSSISTKPIVKETKKVIFYEGAVYGIKYRIDDDGTIGVDTVVEYITSDHDLANEPEEYRRLHDEAENRLIEKGFFLTEMAAYLNIMDNLPGTLDSLRHDIEFENACPVKVCDHLNILVELLKTAKARTQKLVYINSEHQLKTPLRVIPGNIDQCTFKDGVMFNPAIKHGKVEILISQVTFCKPPMTPGCSCKVNPCANKKAGEKHCNGNCCSKKSDNKKSACKNHATAKCCKSVH